MVSNLFSKWAWLQPSKEFKCISDLVGLLWDYLHIETLLKVTFQTPHLSPGEKHDII